MELQNCRELFSYFFCGINQSWPVLWFSGTRQFQFLTFLKGPVPVQFQFLFISNMGPGSGFLLFSSFTNSRFQWNNLSSNIQNIKVDNAKNKSWTFVPWKKEKYHNVFKILNQYQLAYFKALIYTKYTKDCNFFRFFWHCHVVSCLGFSNLWLSPWMPSCHLWRPSTLPYIKSQKNPISNPTFPAKKPYIGPPKKPLFQPPNKHVSILFFKLISDTAPRKPYSNPPKTLIQGTRKPNLMWHLKNSKH
jgi:hypothetical protein